jgi:hypothetical protein
MDERINSLIEQINDFMVERPGVVPMTGILLIALNLLMQIYPGPENWIAASNLFLHLGLILSVAGLLLINVYRR